MVDVSPEVQKRTFLGADEATVAFLRSLRGDQQQSGRGG